jgi:hypothetical protein
MSKRKKRTRSVLRLEDLPNPVAIAQLDAAADAIAKQIDKELGGKPGTETLRSILPASLLLMAVRESKPGPITMQLDDGPEVEVRAVDVETFAMGMMAKSMGALMNDMVSRIVAKGPTKMRLFDGGAVTLKQRWGVRIYLRGKALDWARLDRLNGDPNPSVFATKADADAEVDSLTFLTQQEKRPFTYKAELLPLMVPPTPGASQGGSEKTSRRKGRRKTTAKKR